MEKEPDEALHCKLQPEFFEIFVFLFVFYHFQNMYEYKVTVTEFYRCACLKLRENLFFYVYEIKSRVFKAEWKYVPLKL